MTPNTIARIPRSKRRHQFFAKPSTIEPARILFPFLADLPSGSLLGLIRTKQQRFRICHVDSVADLQILNLASIADSKRVLALRRALGRDRRRRKIDFMHDYSQRLLTRNGRAA